MSSSADNAARPLWPGLSGEDESGPYLRGARCRSCGFVALGQRSQCPECWSPGTMEEVKLGRRGQLYTRSVIHAAPPGYEGPYAVGYVDLDEGIRMFAHLDAGDAAPAIGGRVELTVVPLRTDEEGRPLSGPRYRRAGG